MFTLNAFEQPFQEHLFRGFLDRWRGIGVGVEHLYKEQMDLGPYAPGQVKRIADGLFAAVREVTRNENFFEGKHGDSLRRSLSKRPLTLLIKGRILHPPHKYKNGYRAMDRSGAYEEVGKC